MHARKLLMSVLAGGPLIGVLAGLAVDPTMVPPPEPLWRQHPTPPAAPIGADYQVEAPPQDLDPYLVPPGYRAIMARREAAERRYQASLEQDYPAPSYDVDAAGQMAVQAAAEASSDAAAPPEETAATEPSLLPAEPPAVLDPPQIVL